VNAAWSFFTQLCKLRGGNTCIASETREGENNQRMGGESEGGSNSLLKGQSLSNQTSNLVSRAWKVLREKR